MNRKQFLILMLLLAVLGGVGLALFWQDIAAYRSTGAKIGARLMPDLKLAEVAHISLRDAQHVTTLVRKDNRWLVQERGDYPANVQDISDLLIKLVELKVVQSEIIGTSLLPRVGLAPPPAKPAADAKADDKAKTDDKAKEIGTQVEMKDASGKTVAAVTFGKVVLKKDPGNPLPSAQNGVPAGRYVQVAGAQNIAVVSDPLSKVDADPGKWLDKTFFKVERVKTLTVSGDTGVRWKVTRDEEWGQWKFAAGGGELDGSAAVGAANALSNWTFTDVAVGAQAGGDKPVAVTAETFDRLAYTFRLVPRAAGGYLMNGNVEGEPAPTRTPEKGEKPEEKERRDKDYAESSKRLQERVARERALAKWTYVMDAKAVAPLMKERSELVPPRK